MNSVLICQSEVWLDLLFTDEQLDADARFPKATSRSSRMPLAWETCWISGLYRRSGCGSPILDADVLVPPPPMPGRRPILREQRGRFESGTDVWTTGGRGKPHSAVITPVSTVIGRHIANVDQFNWWTENHHN
jgi:hypothetical protein